MYCFISNTCFNFNALSNKMKSQLHKYEVDAFSPKEKIFSILSIEVEELPLPKEEITYSTPTYDIYQLKDRLIQVQRVNDELIGIIEYEDNKALIYMKKPSFLKEYLLMEYAYTYFMQKEHNAILFHSSSIEYKGHGIIFTAKSGTGKSTQASLWKKYKDVIQINDDKNMVVEEDGILYLYGNPFSGKSCIDTNRKTKLDFIVFIYQNKDNTIRELKGKEALILLMHQIANVSFMMSKEKWNYMTDLILKVKNCYFGCNISLDAVNTLENYLKENSYGIEQ